MSMYFNESSFVHKITDWSKDDSCSVTGIMLPYGAISHLSSAAFGGHFMS